MAKEKDVSKKLAPLDDRVVVRVLDAEEKSAGGILLPDSAKQKPQKGEIIAVGPGKQLDNGERVALSVNKGDIVIFGRYAGNDVEVDGVEVKIMRESDILARVDK